MKRPKKLTKTKWGVYKRDCSGMSKEDKEKMFLESFDDYGKALKYAESYSNKTAIHWIEV